MLKIDLRKLTQKLLLSTRCVYMQAFRGGVVLVLIASNACGSSSNENSEVLENSDNTMTLQENSLTDIVLAQQLPAGDINELGTVVVADDGGDVSDVVASFFRLNRSVAAQALVSQYPVSEPQCTVVTDGVPTFRDISASFVPDIVLGSDAIEAGDTVTIFTDAGTFASLSRQGLGEFIFYGIDPGQMLVTTSPITPFEASVSGSEFPSFSAQSFPEIDALQDFGMSNASNLNGSFNANTEFSWQSTGDESSMIRLVGSTAGGFFLESSISVHCLVPDSGRFVFPANIQAFLGDDFVGGEPMVSRVSINTFISGSAALLLIRESFAR